MQAPTNPPTPTPIAQHPSPNTHHSAPEWIWYPGDFEIWLGNIVNNRRTERGMIFPPFWKQDSHYITVEFTKTFTLEYEEHVSIFCEGRFNIAIDGKLMSNPLMTHMSAKRDTNTPFLYPCVIPAGRHRLSLKVWNQLTPPAIYIDGENIFTDGSWEATYEDKIWVDDNGTPHGAGIYVPVGHGGFTQRDQGPSTYHLDTREQLPASSEPVGRGTLYDFGHETFGTLVFKHPKSDGMITICYGESREEALDTDNCETLDYCSVNALKAESLASKAFRYVYIETIDAAFEQLVMRYEYTPYDPARSGSFRCSDDELNHIWQTAAYTMDLTTREFFLDGIKRDRWTWSGDAIQSYLMNYYLRFNDACVRRTIRQLRGKDPVTAHINTIMDYTFFWLISVDQYYSYTGDKAFLSEIYPKMLSMMAYVEGRLNDQGMAEGKADDWIFVDWTDFPMHKHGILCFEQILLYRAYCAMLRVSHVCGEQKGVIAWTEKATRLGQLIRDTFWNEERGAFLHAIEEGEMNTQVTRFANMFAIIYGIADKRMSQRILDGVLMSDDVNAITTPYMRFYELETLCTMGRQENVLSEIKTYWGGMLREGATTFWEKYVPGEQGREHLAMYGRPYGKSLCHAWGASPIYLLGRYFLGVSPAKPGYETYTVSPVTGGLEWMQGDVPTPFGRIHVEVSGNEVSVSSDGGEGTLILGNRQIPIPAGKEVRVKGE